MKKGNVDLYTIDVRRWVEQEKYNAIDYVSPPIAWRYNASDELLDAIGRVLWINPGNTDHSRNDHIYLVPFKYYDEIKDVNIKMDIYPGIEKFARGWSVPIDVLTKCIFIREDFLEDHAMCIEKSIPKHRKL